MIRKIVVWKEDLDLKRPYTIAYKTVSQVENIFVYLEDDSGRYGIGAASPSEMVCGEVLDQSLKLLQDRLYPLLYRGNPQEYKKYSREMAQLWPAHPAARAAVEMALLDLFGKILDMPLYRFFGGKAQALLTSITLGIQSIEQTLDEVEEYLGRQFKILKLKIGQGLEADLECLQKVREKAGPDILIRVDANQAYQAAELQAFFQKTQSIGIEFVEQPLAQDQAEQMRQVNESIRQRCAADESLRIPLEALELTQKPLRFGIFNIKLMKCGGILPALQIADIAELAGIDLMWGCMDESKVSISAALHAALASPATRYLDLDGSFDLARDLVEGGFRVEDGALIPETGPGLGVKLFSSVSIP